MIGYAVLGGFVLDAIFGDPAWLPHPVVYMGKAISALEKQLRARLPKTPEGELWGGRILAFCLPVGTFAITSLVCMGAAALHPLLGLAVQMFWCGQALAAKGLAQESTRVYRELIKPDLPAARRAAFLRWNFSPMMKVCACSVCTSAPMTPSRGPCGSWMRLQRNRDIARIFQTHASITRSIWEIHAAPHRRS